MLREFIASTASGILVAIVLHFASSGRRGESQPQMRSQPVPPQPQSQPRGGVMGGLMCFLIAVASGIGLAYIAAQFLRVRHFHGGGHDGIAAHAPLLVLTIIFTIVVWLMLSAMTRR